MSDTRELLNIQLQECDNADEAAALLTELAELSLSEGRAEEAQTLLQQAYDARLKGSIEPCPDPLRMNPNQATNVSSQQAPALQTTELVAAVTAAVPSEQSSSSAGADWDKSDDWEPDLTALRKAANLPRETAAVAATANGQVEPQAGGPQGSGGSWRSGSNAATRTSSSSGRPASAGGRPHSSSGRTPETTPPRPRGRGESRLDAASDSDTEWDSISGVPNQPHIVEFHGLNRGVKTSHLDEFLLDYMWGGTTANIKWVDDEHALAVFPCAEAAQQLLDSTQIRYKVRPYSKASGGALQISAEELTPPRSARPKTTTAVARRLISNALGNREVRDRAAERELADLRKANKQERQQRQQQMESVWDDKD